MARNFDAACRHGELPSSSAKGTSSQLSPIRAGVPSDLAELWSVDELLEPWLPLRPDSLTQRNHHLSACAGIGRGVVVGMRVDAKLPDNGRECVRGQIERRAGNFECAQPAVRGGVQAVRCVRVAEDRAIEGRTVGGEGAIGGSRRDTRPRQRRDTSQHSLGEGSDARRGLGCEPRSEQGLPPREWEANRMPPA